jgi:hypothetical protein
MPAAPSYEALFNTKSVFEAALSSFFTLNGLSAYTSRGQEDMPDSRVEIEYEPGQSAGHQATRATTGTGELELDWFQGNIAIRIITERAVVGNSPDAAISNVHAYNVARCKVLMLRGSINGATPGIVASLDLPYHRIVVQSFAGQQDTIPENGFDETVLVYGVQAQILSDAWPVAAP